MGGGSSKVADEAKESERAALSVKSSPCKPCQPLMDALKAENTSLKIKVALLEAEVASLKQASSVHAIQVADSLSILSSPQPSNENGSKMDEEAKVRS